MSTKSKKDDNVFVMPPLDSPELTQFAFDMLENLFPDPKKRMEYVEQLRREEAQQADELKKNK
jgi:hypothetical protein